MVLKTLEMVEKIMRLQANAGRRYEGISYDINKVKKEPTRDDYITIEDSSPKLVLSEDEEDVSSASTEDKAETETKSNPDVKTTSTISTTENDASTEAVDNGEKPTKKRLTKLIRMAKSDVPQKKTGSSSKDNQ